METIIDVCRRSTLFYTFDEPKGLEVFFGDIRPWHPHLHCEFFYYNTEHRVPGYDTFTYLVTSVPYLSHEDHQLLMNRTSPGHIYVIPRRGLLDGVVCTIYSKVTMNIPQYLNPWRAFSNPDGNLLWVHSDDRCHTILHVLPFRGWEEYKSDDLSITGELLRCEEFCLLETEMSRRQRRSIKNRLDAPPLGNCRLVDTSFPRSTIVTFTSCHGQYWVLMPHNIDSFAVDDGHGNAYNGTYLDDPHQIQVKFGSDTYVGNFDFHQDTLMWDNGYIWQIKGKEPIEFDLESDAEQLRQTYDQTVQRMIAQAAMGFITINSTDQSPDDGMSNCDQVITSVTLGDDQSDAEGDNQSDAEGDDQSDAEGDGLDVVDSPTQVTIYHPMLEMFASQLSDLARRSDVPPGDVFDLLRSLKQYFSTVLLTRS